MDKLITDAIQGGKYVVIDDAPLKSMTLLDAPITVEFDASVCKSVYCWSTDQCSCTTRGKIEFHIFPQGYMPELSINGVIHRYHYRKVLTRKQLIIADSEDLYQSYKWYMTYKDSKPPSDTRRKVYKWNSSYGNWCKSGTYRDTTVDCIVGLEEVYNAILQDVQILTSKKDMLSTLGMSSSVNVLLESKPGMGKTSLIRALATTLNEHIHTITSSAINSTTPDVIFKQHCKSGSISIYVFEDFDRYLNTVGQEQMASLLNALDGVENMPPSLRIFTANTHINGKKMEAFLSRMRRRVSIDEHPHAAYRRSISIIFPEKDKKLMETLVLFFSQRKFTMRQVNNLLCASIVYDDPVSYIMNSVTQSK